MKIAVIVGMILITLGIIAFMFFGGSGSGNTVKILGEEDGSTPMTGQTTLRSIFDSGETKEFTMNATDFAFSPEVIEVNEGDKVILYVTSTDVAHGIAIPEFNVNQDLPVGEEKKIQFLADKKGTFNFLCNAYCGSSHREMTGSLIVN